jgi:hypothetical protein
MKGALVWMRANLITVASAVVAVVAIAAMVWFYMQGSALQQQMAERTSELDSVEQLMNQGGTLPAASVGGEEREFNRQTFKQVDVEQLKRIYSGLNEQYEQMYSAAEQHNRQGHQQLMPNLFPDASESMRFNARDRYLSAFRWMLQSSGETQDRLGLPRLNAGPPISQQQLQMALQRVRPSSGTDNSAQQANLTPQQRQQREQKQQQELLERRKDAYVRALRNHAAGIDLYAYTQAGLFSEMFPFHARAWPASGDQPSMVQLWERQLELWIQQDIAQAIANMNADAESVLDAPVKRLVRMQVVPGYVGLHTGGAVGGDGGSSGGNDLIIGSGSGGGSGSGASSGGVPSQWRGGYPVPDSDLLGEEDGPTPNNFLVTPSGRISNPIYDVRHAIVTVVLNYEQLPDFMNELSRTNFMTVLQTQIQDVDEYQALQRGYVYTGGDAVRARLVVETIWLRSWTKDLMPQVTKQYLGIAEPPENQGDQTTPSFSN